MRRTFALALCLIGLVTFALPPTEAVHELAVRKILPNGLALIVLERPALPVVQVRAVVKAGAVVDPPAKGGLANLTASLLTRGTTTRTATQIDEAIEFVGGSLGSSGGQDTAGVGLTVLRKDLGLGLDLLADVLQHPAFPEGEFNRKVRQIQASIRRSEEEPRMVAQRAFQALLFGAHPYGRPAVGTVQSLEAISRADVVAFHGLHYSPQGTLLVMVGAISPDEAIRKVTRRFGPWAEGDRGLPVVAKAPSTPRAATEPIAKELSQSTILLGQPAIGRDHPDYYPLSLLTYIIGGGSTSRLYGRIRDQLGLSYAIYSYLSPGLYGNTFVVSAQTKTASTRQVIDETRAILTRVRDEGVSQAELELAKAYLIGSFALRMDTNAKMADLLGNIELFGLGFEYPHRYPQLIGAVTREEIQRVARKHLNPEAMALVVVGNLSEAGFKEGTPTRQ